MSALLIVLLVWLGLAALVIVAGLSITTRTVPERYVVMRAVESAEAQSEDAPEYREAA